MIKERRLEPPEERTKTRNIKLYVEYEGKIEIPEQWDDEDIKDYIKEEYIYLINDLEYTIEDMEV